MYRNFSHHTAPIVIAILVMLTSRGDTTAPDVLRQEQLDRSRPRDHSQTKALSVVGRPALRAAARVEGHPPYARQNSGAPIAHNGKFSLTVRDAVDRALPCDQGIAAVRAALMDADWQEARARQLRDPELRPSHDDGSTEVTARLYIPNPWVRSHRVEAAVSAGKATLAELEQATWLLETHVRRLFTDIDFQDRDVALVEELVALRHDALELARQRLGSGQATTPELVPVSGRYITALSERDAAERKRGRVRRQLAALVMLPDHELTLAADSVGNLPADLTGLRLGELEQRATEHRADLRALSWRAGAALATCGEARSERTPWFRHVQASQTQNSGGRDEWSVAMAISIPVFSWSSRKPTVAAANYRRLRAAVTQASQRVGQEVRNAWRAVEEALGAQHRYEERATSLADELNTVLAELREADGAFQSQIIDIRVQLLGIERTRLRLRRETMQGVIQLEEAVGTRLYCEGNE